MAVSLGSPPSASNPAHHRASPKGSFGHAADPSSLQSRSPSSRARRGRVSRPCLICWNVQPFGASALLEVVENPACMVHSCNSKQWYTERGERADKSTRQAGPPRHRPRRPVGLPFAQPSCSSLAGAVMNGNDGRIGDSMVAVVCDPEENGVCSGRWPPPPQPYADCRVCGEWEK